MLLELFDDGLKFFVLLETQSLDGWLNIFLLDTGLIEEVVVSLQLLDLNNGVDHLRGDALASHELVHLLLGLEFGGFELADGVHNLFTCQFDDSALTKGVAESLNFLLVDGSLGWVHKVNLSGLLEDLLGDLKGLVEVSLDEGVGELLPVGSGKDKLLELLLVASGDGCSTLDGVLGETFSGLLMGVLDDDLASLKEVIEGHGAILLVLGLSKKLTFSDEAGDDTCGRLGALELGLLLRLLLGDDESTETLKILVVLEVVVSAGLGKVGKIKAELNNEGIGGLAHLNSLNLRLGLGRGGELEGLELAEHVHVSLELELGGSDDLILSLLNGLGLKSHADLGVLLLDLRAKVLSFHVLSNGELVVLGFELNPLASFLGDVDEALLVLDLTLTEGGDVFLLVLLTEETEFLLVKLGTLGSE